MKRILFIKGTSSYDLARIFADAYIDAFRKKAITVDILDVKHEDLNKQIAFFKTQDYDLVISSNSSLLAERNAYLKNPDTLCWSILIGHPYYHHQRLLDNKHNQVVSCVDHAHMRYLRKYYPHINYTCFLPHGGNVPPVSPKNFHEREITVVLLGSYTDPRVLNKNMNQYPDLLKLISEQIIESYCTTYSNTLEDLFAYYFNEYQLNFSNEDFASVLSSLVNVDLYIRSKNRERISNTLVSNNITVDIFGSGWENFQCSNPENLRYHGAIPYTEAVEKMCNAKIVLNPLPLFTNGSHERVFTSMLCGAVCISERNNYLENEFTDNENICFYNMLDLDKLPERINQLLAEPAKAASIAQKGLALACQKHTWANCA